MDIFTLVGKIVLDGADKAKTQLQGIEGYVKNNEKAFKIAGTAITGFGVAITGALVMAVKSAAEEEAGIIKLTQALKNVGVEYDAVKESLEANINATMQKTAVADDAQREALASLVAITGDYNKALSLLPLTLDLAAGKGMDLVSSSQVIGRVAQGNTTILTRYGIELKAGADATEALGELQAKYGGQAEAYGRSMAGQFELLKNNISDLSEAIGSSLIPILTDLLKNYISPAILGIKGWIDVHPELTKQVTILSGVVGGLALVLGPILLMLPTLVTSIGYLKVAMLGLNVAMGPTGWIIAGILAALTILIPLAVTTTEKAKDWTFAIKENTGAQLKQMGIIEKVIAMHKGASISVEELGKAERDEAAATDEQTAAKKRLYEAEQSLSQQFGDLLAQLRYNDSQAQAYNLTIDDVYTSMQLLGYTTEEIRNIFNKYGRDTNFTQFALDDLGLSAREVAILTGKLKEETDKGTVAWENYGDAAKGAAITVGESLTDIRNAIAGTTGATREAAMLRYINALHEAGAPLIAAGMEPTEAYNKVRPELTSIPAYQHGGMIEEPTLLSRLSDLKPYAVAGEAGKEYVTPAGQKVNIFVELDGRTIAKVIGQPLMEEIRLKTGVKI